MMVLATGEGDTETAKVQGFHSATLGYAQLIFLDEKAQLATFMNAISTVISAYRGDLKLPSKLVRIQINIYFIEHNPFKAVWIIDIVKPSCEHHDQILTLVNDSALAMSLRTWLWVYSSPAITKNGRKMKHDARKSRVSRYCVICWKIGSPHGTQKTSC